jgi:sec-independent protein translocase protein TatC
MRRDDFDPDSYRMSVGDHLEELRSHLIKAGIGVLIAFVGCLAIAQWVLLPFIAGPLIEALRENDVSPQLYQTGVADPFMVYLRLSLIGAFVISGPWVIYQAWSFIAAGLYPKERRAATRFLPLSFFLFFGGVTFVWWVILPLTLGFFLGFASKIPLPTGLEDAPAVAVEAGAVGRVDVVAGNPEPLEPFAVWFDSVTQRFKLAVPDRDGEVRVRVIPFGSENLVAPIITLPDYVNLVLVLLIVFGISFQLPLVVAGLVRSGIVPAATLRGQRRLVYFAMVVVACVVTPGDVVTATIGLLGPLILLFEAGIWLGERGRARAARTA